MALLLNELQGLHALYVILIYCINTKLTVRATRDHYIGKLQDKNNNLNLNSIRYYKYTNNALFCGFFLF